MRRRQIVQGLVLCMIVGLCAASAFAGEHNIGSLNQDGQAFPATYWSNVVSVGTADAGYWHVTLVDGSQIWVIRPEHVQMVLISKFYGLPLFVTWADQYGWTELAVRY